MRIAILADIHGNLPALKAALQKIDELGVDEVVVAGDVVVGSPDSLACWEKVKSLNCPVLRGNHERYAYDLGTERARPEWTTPQFGPVQYAAAQLGLGNLRELAALPATLTVPSALDLLIVHGSARNDTDLVFPYTSAEELAPMFAGTTQKWIVRGHNHYAGVHLWGNRFIITAGSVGLPLDGSPVAQFCVVEQQGAEWRVRHYGVPYDVNAALRRFHETDYLRAAGPMARLFMREVATASFHIMPFLKFESRLNALGEHRSLDEAVDLFLRLGAGERLR